MNRQKEEEKFRLLAEEQELKAEACLRETNFAAARKHFRNAANFMREAVACAFVDKRFEWAEHLLRGAATYDTFADHPTMALTRTDQRLMVEAADAAWKRGYPSPPPEWKNKEPTIEEAMERIHWKGSYWRALFDHRNEIKTEVQHTGDTVTLVQDQAERILHACNWRLEESEDEVARTTYRAVANDGEARTRWYYEKRAALFFALAAHIGNGHWKPKEN